MGRMRTFGFNDYINIFNMNILIRIEKKEKKSSFNCHKTGPKCLLASHSNPVDSLLRLQECVNVNIFL